jgi:nucleoside-diphosphate-sugar epimerase
MDIDKTILITGSNGFIGSHVLAFLSSKNYKVFGITEEITDIEKLGPHFKNVDFVIHLAAKTNKNKHREDGSDDFFEVNVGGTMNVVRLCVEYGCKLINISSGSVARRKKDEYGITKTLAEELVGMYAKNMGLRAVSIRPCKLYDKDQKDKWGTKMTLFVYNSYPLEQLCNDIENIILNYKFKKYKVYNARTFFVYSCFLIGKTFRAVRRRLHLA